MEFPVIFNHFITKVAIGSAYIIAIIISGFLMCLGGYMIFGPKVPENSLTIPFGIMYGVAGFAQFHLCMKWNEPIRKYLGFSK